MKILLVVHLFLPDYFSGTEILTLHTALELKSRGHEVQVLTGFPATVPLSDVERFDRYLHEGIPVTRFKHAHAAMGEQSNVAEQEYDNHLSARKFTALLDEFQPDLVHFFHLMRISASVVDICRARGLPMVLTPTDFWFICPTSQLRLPDGSMCPGPDELGANCVRHLASLKMRGLAASALNHLPAPLLSGVVRLASRTPLRLVKPANLVAALSQRQAFLKDRLNRIDKVLVPTRSMQQILHQHGLDPAHVRFCSYGIRMPHRPARGPRMQGPLRLGVIGFGEHKGAHVVIEALRKLPDADLALKVYGRPTDFPDYARRLEQLAAADPRVQLCGSFPNDQIGVILSQLEILLVPSLWFENAPLVIYSAQAAGVPVVASDVTGVAELITDGDNGRLFPPGDVDRLAGIIAALAQDRSQIARYSERARMPKTIAAYTVELLAVYGELGADVGQPA